MFARILSVIVLIPAFAFAADDGMSTFLCNAYGIFNGPLGQALAIFAIVALGVGLFMGKITWGLVFAVALGVGAIFGAPKIAALITGGTEICAGSSTS